MAKVETHRDWIMESLIAEVGTHDPAIDRGSLFAETGDALPEGANRFGHIGWDMDTDAAW